ncbi:hypothetical protein L2E82_36062 [Cichorium intybus]|uniref:Uncharacterized protein n=1 Tax=Cichorium intybus TaxID=13427 RepID=A0ACB9BQK7_CICIN|nr:hypothetical protein L2E82_36062 [Cichorium intybus]
MLDISKRGTNLQKGICGSNSAESVFASDCSDLVNFSMVMEIESVEKSNGMVLDANLNQNLEGNQKQIGLVRDYVIQEKVIGGSIEFSFFPSILKIGIASFAGKAPQRRPSRIISVGYPGCIKAKSGIHV